MGQPGSRGGRIELSVAILLTWIAGVVDAIGFLSFSRIYTANMSGNSVAIGIALGRQEWPMAFFRFWPVLIYVLGLVIGRLTLEIGARLEFRRIASLVFLAESVLLILAAWAGTSARASQHDLQTYLGIALLAFAMGAQNAAFTRFSSLTLHTGFVTGTLLKASSEFVKLITWIWEKRRAGFTLARTLRASTRESCFRLAFFLSITWLAYVAGAVIGAVGLTAIRQNAVLFAIAGLVLLTFVDFRDPLAVQDEKEQNKGS